MPVDNVFCRDGGCTAKLGPAILEKILAKLPRGNDANLLVGFDHSDDAAVYRVSDDLAIVQTLDFFPPMVEDPYIFGQIAAANAMSDVYAMGGTVKTALNIVCFPETMDMNILGHVLEGGNNKVMEAGGILAGGHSINDEGIKYGLSVTGFLDPRLILSNNSCQAGDALILTKPLGVGIICTATRVGDCSPEAYALAIRSMTTLNNLASRVALRCGAHACTDVTGFGLLAHLSEMLNKTLSARLYMPSIPIIEAALGYADDFYLTTAAQRNRNHVGGSVRFTRCSFAQEELLYDPQTSGGLLLSLPEDKVEDALSELREQNLPCARIGEITERRERAIEVYS